MNILLVGSSGAMGKAIIDLVGKTEEDKIVLGLQAEPANTQKFPVYASFAELSEHIKNNELSLDVMIDFSTPKITNELLDFAKQFKFPILIATTGQSDEQEEAIEAASQTIPIINTHNTSIGVNVMQKALELLTRSLYPLGYDIEIVESHHRYKKDAPSGTAKMLLKTIEDTADDAIQVEEGRSGLSQGRSHAEIGVHAIRAGEIVGKHSILYANNQETIEITHTASSKELFAKGALLAGRFLSDAEVGLYDMSDVLRLNDHSQL